MSRVRVSHLAVLSLTAAALWFGFLALQRRENPPGPQPPELRTLIESLDGLRIWEPRMSGGFSYAECQSGPSCSAPPAIGTERHGQLAALGRQLRARDERLAGPERLRLKALWSLVWPSDLKATSRAIDWLEQAVELSHGESSHLNDLAAAYLIRAQRHGRALDLLRALDAAESALDAAEPLSEALFNRNLALEKMGLYLEARTLWAQYASRFSDSAWADEAGARAKALDLRLARGDWPRLKASLDMAITANDRTQVRELAQRHSRQVRRYLETDYLTTLRRAFDLDGPATFDRVLQAGELASQTVAEESGDFMAMDHLIALRTAQSRGSTDLRHFLASVEAYSEGYTRYREREFSAARKRLEAAGTMLEGVGSPLAGWADFHLSLCDYQQFRYHEALARLRRLDHATASDRYPVLAARAAQIQGLIESIQGDPALGIRHFLAALALAEQVADVALVAGLETQIAANYGQLGNLDRSWAHLHRALQASDQMDNPLAVHVLLEEAVRTALQLEQQAAAVRLQAALTTRSQALGDAITSAQALLGRAALHLELGQIEQASRSAGMAREALQPITAAEARQAVEGDLLLLEGRLFQAQDPTRALKALDEADAIFHRTEYELRQAETRFLQAKAELALGRRDSASHLLQQALEGIQAERAAIGPLGLRDRFFDQRRDIFEQRLLLLADEAEGAAASFQLAQRLKARTLLELIARQPAQPDWQPLDLDEVRRLLAPDQSLVDYVITDGQTLVWHVSHESFGLRRLAIGAQALRGLVERFRLSLTGGGSRADIRRASAALFTSLLDPIWDRVSSTPRLIFAPDGPLHLVPFAALWNPKSSRYLVESHEISLVPSAAVLAHTAKLAAEPGTDAPISPLLIGVPEGDAVMSHLPRLPMARQEVRAVASLWPRSVVLLGSEATRARVLEEAKRATLIHFAGHSIPHPDSPLLSQFVLAPGEGDSGILYGRDLLTTGLRARLAVLSACGTASGSAASTYGLASLAQILMAAGVPTVLGTLWDTDDRITAEFVEVFHRHLRAGLEPAVALRETQLAWARSTLTGFDSPAGWAAFQLMGAANEPLPGTTLGVGNDDHSNTGGGTDRVPLGR